MQPNSTNQQTIGINKHGTLLSSQTTDTIRILCDCISSLRLITNLYSFPTRCQIRFVPGCSTPILHYPTQNDLQFSPCEKRWTATTCQYIEGSGCHSSAATHETLHADQTPRNFRRWCRRHCPVTQEISTVARVRFPRRSTKNRP